MENQKNKSHVLLKFGVKNLNDRSYSVEEFTETKTRTVTDNKGVPRKEDYIILDELNNGFPLLGQLGYPESFDINMSKVSHRFTNIRIEEDLLVGDLEVLETTFGEKLKSMLDTVVFRPRSSGTVNEDGSVSLKNVFTFDAVLKDNDAYKGIIEEHTIKS